MAVAVWRRDPEVTAAAAGMDEAAIEEIARLFAETVETQALFAGGQLALYRNGRLVLDTGGGLARRRPGTPVTPETMFVIFSSTKGLTALALWMMHERGALHIDEPVTKYWPEFPRLDTIKAGITIRHVLSHRGGFPKAPDWYTARAWGDRATLRRAMEEAPQMWTPGEANGYHDLNGGWVLSELVQLIDKQGRTVGEYLRDEVFAPLRVPDLYLGLPDDPALEARVAWFEDPAEAAALAARAEVEGKSRPDPELSIPWNRPNVHQMVIPAGGGIGTARSLGKVYAALALGGELDGVRVIRRDTIDAAIAPTVRPGEVDRIIGMPMRWGTGWSSGGAVPGATTRTFGHGGRGGQVGMADLDRGLAIGLTVTGQLQMEPYQQWAAQIQALALGACR